MRTVAFLLIVFLSIWGRAQAAKTWVIAIGIDHYEDASISPLRYAENDASLIANCLESMGAERVVLLKSGSKERSEQPTRAVILEKLSVIAKMSKPEDTFIFYFSGHGMARQKECFLTTADCRLDDLEATALPFDLLKKRVQQIKAAKRLFVLDACRNDPYAGGKSGVNIRTSILSKDLVMAASAGPTGVQTSTVVLWACSLGERSYELTDLNNGVFTFYLVEALKSKEGSLPNGGISPYELMAAVQDRMEEWSLKSGRMQRPDWDAQGRARFVLFEPAVTPAVRLPKGEKQPVLVVAELNSLEASVEFSSLTSSLEAAYNRIEGAVQFAYNYPFLNPQSAQRYIELHLKPELTFDERYELDTIQRDARTLRSEATKLDDKRASLSSSELKRWEELQSYLNNVGRFVDEIYDKGQKITEKIFGQLQKMGGLQQKAALKLALERGASSIVTVSVTAGDAKDTTKEIGRIVDELYRRSEQGASDAEIAQLNGLKAVSPPAPLPVGVIIDQQLTSLSTGLSALLKSEYAEFDDTKSLIQFVEKNQVSPPSAFLRLREIWASDDPRLIDEKAGLIKEIEKKSDEYRRLSTKPLLASEEVSRLSEMTGQIQSSEILTQMWSRIAQSRYEFKRRRLNLKVVLAIDEAARNVASKMGLLGVKYVGDVTVLAPGQVDITKEAALELTRILNK